MQRVTKRFFQNIFIGKTKKPVGKNLSGLSVLLLYIYRENTLRAITDRFVLPQVCFCPRKLPTKSRREGIFHAKFVHRTKIAIKWGKKAQNLKISSIFFNYLVFSLIFKI